MILVCCSRMWAVKTCESAEQATPNASAVTMRERFRNSGFCSGRAAVWRYASPRADFRVFNAATCALQWGNRNNMAAGCSILNANVHTELYQPG